VKPVYYIPTFRWLYGSQNPARTSVPLVMWLQGGPGASSLFGDFIEIGPVDVNLKPRNTSWLALANLLFVDNPIGAGFSYTNDPNGFSTTDAGIANNLVIFMQMFLQQYPVFQTMEFWIFSESYGGKMTAAFGRALDMAIKKGQLNINFKGVGLGDSWIDPIGCMYSYPPFLLAISEIDENQAGILNTYAKEAEEQYNSGNGVNATNLWGQQQSTYEYFTGGVNVYNFLTYESYIPEGQLETLLNGPMKQKLGIPSNITWGGQSGDVFNAMSGQFMRSGIDDVEYLLEANYQVAVYSGQLDLIVDVICTEKWMDQLTWSGMAQFQVAPKNIASINGIPNGWSKQYQNLQFWAVYNAGHMVPYDNAEMAYTMFETIIN